MSLKTLYFNMFIYFWSLFIFTLMLIYHQNFCNNLNIFIILFNYGWLKSRMIYFGTVSFIIINLSSTYFNISDFNVDS